MRTLAYSVYDNKALVYAVPFFATTDGSAIRSFQDLANDTNTTVGRHPGDFSLYCLGDYDDQKGVLTALSPLRHVVDATALLVRQEGLPFDRPNGKAQPTDEEVRAWIRDQGGNV